MAGKIVRRLGWLSAILLLSWTSAPWAQRVPEVYFMEPPDGVVIKGEPWVEVTGRARSPEPQPPTFDVMIVLDTSGSTRNPSGVGGTFTAGGPGGSFEWFQRRSDSILHAEAGAAIQFLGISDPATTRVGIITFAGAHQALTGLAVPGSTDAWVERPLTFDYAATRAALLDIVRRGSKGGTDMGSGLRLGIRELLALESARSQPRSRARKVLLLLTDGFPTLPFGSVNVMDPGDVEVTTSAARVAAKGGIVIHTFCLGPEALSAPIACAEAARITGGLYTPVETPGDIVDILPKTRIADVDLIAVRNATTGQMARDLSVSPDGIFTAEVPLVAGGNQLVVELHGNDGLQGSAAIVVQYRDESVKVEVSREPERTLTIQVEQPRRDQRLDLRIERLDPTR
ncbi:MAG: VWA domain-containing protein [Candidatus Methylomirabilia bacterium]